MIIKVVPDTSSLIRGFTSYLNPQRQVINLAVANKISLYGSSVTYREFASKVKHTRFQRFLKPKLLTSEVLLNYFSTLLTLIEPDVSLKNLQVCRDPKDDIFLIVAKTIGSSIIISEDNDLLSISRYENIRILNAETFMKLYKRVFAN